LATASVTDEEMAERIARHKAARGERWMTVEEPLDVPEVVRKRGKEMEVLLVDCITIWLSNLMLKGHNDEEIVARVRDLVDVIDEVPCSWAMVTNEVGWGVVPDHPLGRRFRDLTGSVNQRLARTADQVVLMVAGQPVMIKGG
jgi:adenosylcobinamide kinase/adenosylcobinamide-phosphate guanylyltransferase